MEGKGEGLKRIEGLKFDISNLYRMNDNLNKSIRGNIYHDRKALKGVKLKKLQGRM